MDQVHYPLHIIQNYVVPRGEAEHIFRFIGRLSRKSLEKVAAVSKKRIEAVPLAAYVLSRMVDAIQPERLVFSAYWLRQGHLYDLLPGAERKQDPLLVARPIQGGTNPRFRIVGEER